jgi:hypothetical protein
VTRGGRVSFVRVAGHWGISMKNTYTVNDGSMSLPGRITRSGFQVSLMPRTMERLTVHAFPLQESFPFRLHSMRSRPR